ncbi:MAG: MogA/MoaB family molybdenum cofactor biosynthesis protein [Thermoanaerobaculia bacterium]
MQNIRASVITCSDAASKGERVDESGPAVRELLLTHGFAAADLVVVPDTLEAISSAIVEAVDRRGARLVVTTGGTGIAPRDITPEATNRVSDKLVPGFGEAMRAASLLRTPMGALSRAQAATRGTALIVNLPGNPKGAQECLDAVIQLIPHALELLAGGKVEKHPTASRV